MLAFSVNAYACVELPEKFLDVLEANNRNPSDTSPEVCQELGDLYLRVCGVYKKQVTADVNPHAYIGKSHINNELKKVHTLVPIFTDAEMDDENLGAMGVSESVLGYTDVALDGVEERDEFLHALSELLSMAEYIALEDDIDLIVAMRRALVGDKRAIDKIKYVKDTYVGMSDILLTVLSGNWTKYIGVA